MLTVSGGIASRLTDSIRNLAPIGRSLLAGYGAAFVFAGIGSRLAMRITAIMAGPEHLGGLTDAEETVGVISADGTMFLVFFGALIGGLAGGFAYAAVRPWLPSRRAGAVFGLFALAVGGGHVIEARNPDFALLGSPVVNIVMFGALFVLGGISTHWLYGHLNRYRGAGATGLFGSLAVVVFVPALVGIGGVTTDVTSIGLPGTAAVPICVLAAALVAQMVASHRAGAPLEDVDAWMGPRLRLGGHLAGGVAAAIGFWGLAGEVVGILTTVN